MGNGLLRYAAEQRNGALAYVFNFVNEHKKYKFYDKLLFIAYGENSSHPLETK